MQAGLFICGVSHGSSGPLAVFDVAADAAISQVDRLRIAAQLAAHGIDCLILPPGVSLALMSGADCDPLDDDE